MAEAGEKTDEQRLDELVAAAASNTYPEGLSSDSFDELVNKNKALVSTNAARLLTEGFIPGCKAASGTAKQPAAHFAVDALSKAVAPRNMGPLKEPLFAAAKAFVEAGLCEAKHGCQGLVEMLQKLSLRSKDDEALKQEVVDLLMQMESQQSAPDSGAYTFTSALNNYEWYNDSAPQLAKHATYLVDMLVQKRYGHGSDYGARPVIGVACEHNVDAFARADFVDYMVDEIDNDHSAFSTWMNCIKAIATSKPELLGSNIDFLLELCDDYQMGSSVFMSLVTPLSDHESMRLRMMALVDTIEKNLDKFGSPNLLGMVSVFLQKVCAGSGEQAKRGMRMLMKMGVAADAMYAAGVLWPMRTLYTCGHVEVEFLDELKDDLEKLRARQDPTIAAALKGLQDVRDGLTIENVSAEVKDVDERAQGAAADAMAVAQEAKAEIADIKSYIDERLDDMKEWVGEVVKKLPVPAMFGTKSVMMGAGKKLTLYFECCTKGDSCAYPGKAPGNAFTTDTKVLNKWLKVAVSSVQLGLAVMEQDPIGGVGAVKAVFDHAMTDYGKDFKAFVCEPFLTSEESDNLINQLREANFFDSFTYDGISRGWQCNRCQRAKEMAKEQKEAAKAAEEAAKAAEAAKAVEAAAAEKAAAVASVTTTEPAAAAASAPAPTAAASAPAPAAAAAAAAASAPAPAAGAAAAAATPAPSSAAAPTAKAARSAPKSFSRSSVEHRGDLRRRCGSFKKKFKPYNTELTGEAFRILKPGPTTKYEFNLEEIERVHAVPKEKFGQDHVFAVVTTGKSGTVYLQAQDDAARQDWIDKFENNLRVSQSGGGGGGDK